VRTTAKAPALTIILLVCLSLLILVTRFNVTTDLGVFMPPGETVTERVLMSQLDRGSTSNLVFAGIQGVDAEQLAELNRQLSDRLSENALFVQVLNGERAMSEEDRSWVMDNRYHLTGSDLEDRFSEDGLRRALDDRLRGLTSPLGALEKQFLPRDPTGEIINLLGKWQADLSADDGPDKLHGVWFSREHDRTVLMIELASSGLDLELQEQAVREIHQEFDALAPSEARLVLAGPSVFAVETRDVITRDARILSVVATVLVVLFLFAAFRSLQLLGLVLVPLVCGVLAAAAVVLLAFGNIHGITLAFGITLTGVAVDYPIHFFSHLKGGRARAEESIRTIWPTLSLGVISTIIAYVVLVLSDFRGLQQLGLFTVVGLLMAAAVTRWILPFLVPSELVLGGGLPGVQRVLRRMGGVLSGKGMWSLLLIPLSIAAVYVSSTPLRDLDVDSLSPIGEDRRTEDRELRNDLGFWYGGRLAVVVAPSAEGALKRSEALRLELDELIEAGAITRYDMAASFIPSQELQRRQIDAIPAEAELRRRLASVVTESPFREEIFEPFIEEAVEARDRPLLTVESLSNTQMGVRLEALLFEQDGIWIAPVLLHGVDDESQLDALNRSDGDTQVIYLNIKERATEVLATAIDHVIPLLGFGVLAIYLLLLVAYRSVLKPLRVLFPTLSAVAVTLAILNLSGISLTLMHLVSMLLIIGLGLDYALFYNRLNDDEAEWQTTFKALWVSSFTTVMVFGILFFSNTPPLQAIGLTVGIGALLCLVFGACWTRRPRPAGSADGS
jgi:predicted exporter